jgi:hypothetical protein
MKSGLVRGLVFDVSVLIKKRTTVFVKGIISRKPPFKK